MSRDLFINVIDRIKREEGLTKDADVAKLLGLKKTAFAARKDRGSLPMERIELYCERKSINVDWLVREQGPKSTSRISDVPAVGYSTLDEETIEDVRLVLRLGTDKERRELRGMLRELVDGIRRRR